jgi:hypothetical protein
MRKRKIYLSQAQEELIAARMAGMAMANPAMRKEDFLAASKSLAEDERPVFSPTKWHPLVVGVLQGIYERSRKVKDLEQQIEDLKARIDQLRAEKSKAYIEPLEVLQTAMPSELVHNCWDSLMKIPLQKKLELLPMNVILGNIPTPQLIRLMADRLANLVEAIPTTATTTSTQPTVTTQAVKPKLPKVMILGLLPEQSRCVEKALEGMAAVYCVPKDLGTNYTIPGNTKLILVMKKFVSHPMTARVPVTDNGDVKTIYHDGGVNTAIAQIKAHLSV